MRISRPQLFLLVPILSGWTILQESTAVAQEEILCVPYAWGVPGYDGPPIWWEMEGAQPYSSDAPTDTDPRWHGALRITHGSTDIENVSMRALYSPWWYGGDQTERLYLSWKIESDTIVVGGGQKVLVGLAPDCSSGECNGDGQRYVIAVDLDYSTLDSFIPTPENPRPPWVNYYVYEHDPSEPPPVSPPIGQDAYAQVATSPAWLQMGVWFVPADNTWTVSLAIPLNGDSGLWLTSDFFMTYQVRMKGPQSSTVFKTWPRNQPGSAMSHTPTGAPALVMALAPWVASWGRFHMGSSGGGERAGALAFGECAQGISLNGSDIGTVPEDGNVTGWLSSEIRRDADAENVNTFVARPENSTGESVGQGTIHAIFRIANWGSTPIGDIDFAHGDWTDIYDGHAPRPQVVNEEDISDGQKGLIQADWYPMTQLEMCRYGAPGATNCEGIERKSNHQCILVELRSPGGDYVFTSESAQRNMDFVGLAADSRSLSLEGVVTPRGAPPIPGQDARLMYLQVDARNLPAEMSPDEYQQALDELDDRYATWEDEQGSFADLARFMPTVMVHVYHETGELDPYDGSPVINDQASFGFFVWPPRDQTPIDWRLAIDGVEEIEPDVYAMEVSDTGTAVVRVRMKALTEGDTSFEPADAAWRSSEFCDTRTEGIDAQECEVKPEPEPDPWPICGGCHSEPTAAGHVGRGGLLVLGLAFLGWYGLRRRRHAARARA